MCACVRACVRAVCVRACARVRACACARSPVRVFACVRACVCTNTVPSTLGLCPSNDATLNEINTTAEPTECE